jgi:ferredoxin
VKLLFLYFSGTGNTDYVAQYLARKLAHVPVDIASLSIEHRPAEMVGDFDLLTVGFPVYACDSPDLVQDYLARLPPGEGRGAFVFCTKGAYAGGAVRHNLQRLAVRGYTPLGGGSVLMPGTDGLAMIPKGSWMARKALEKDFDHLQDADRLAEHMTTAISGLRDGRSVEEFRETLPPHPKVSVPDRLWAFLYEASENWARARLHADQGCEGCGLCSRVCPVASVQMQGRRPTFADQCVLCMRCIHACPQEAIQIGGLTVGKFRWKGPGGNFMPLRMRPR